MQYSSAILVATFAITNVFAQGAVNSIRSTNDINVANLLVDGTPGDCSTLDCVSGSVDIVHNVSEKKSKNSGSAGAFGGSVHVVNSSGTGALLKTDIAVEVDEKKTKSSALAGAIEGSIDIVDTSESNQKRSIENRPSKLRFARAPVSKA
ncbi:hypothetical protein K3495_g9781 [Podosphaera aphanis]|nr:hypothetical protein K3495_g9781 [Podosphaera aphanis]